MQVEESGHQIQGIDPSMNRFKRVMVIATNIYMIYMHIERERALYDRS